MNISYLKKQLISANSAIFEVNKKGIVWSNNYFDSLFNFLNEYDLKNNLSLKSSKNNFYLKLKINKEITAYDSQCLVKNSESSIYKINDEQIKYILALKEGMECFSKGQINLDTFSCAVCYNCVSTCPHDIWRMPESFGEQVQIVEENADSCSLDMECVSKCPTGAIEIVSSSLSNLEETTASGNFV